MSSSVFSGFSGTVLNEAKQPIKNAKLFIDGRNVDISDDGFFNVFLPTGIYKFEVFYLFLYYEDKF